MEKPKKTTTSNNRKKSKTKENQNLNEEKENHVLIKMNSSRLVVSFRNSTMLESSTERLFPVCICWRRRKKSENEFVDWFFVLGSENKKKN